MFPSMTHVNFVPVIELSIRGIPSFVMSVTRLTVSKADLINNA